MTALSLLESHDASLRSELHPGHAACTRAAVELAASIRTISLTTPSMPSSPGRSGSRSSPQTANWLQPCRVRCSSRKRTPPIR